MMAKTVFISVQLTRWCTAMSALSLIAMMLVTVADVVMANLFHRPIVGVFDLVETTLVLAVFMGFPATFLSGSHIAVDVVDFFASPKTLKRLKMLGKLLSFVFLVFLAWQMLTPAHDSFKYGERKQELGLPLFVLWIPMIFGIAVSAVMVLFSFRENESSSSEGKEQ